MKTIGTDFKILQEPYNFLDTNPNPQPKTQLQEHKMEQMIGDALQIVGFKAEGQIKVLAVESGPTFQTVSFRLPGEIQLSQLISKRDKLANHLGHFRGFDVTAAPHFENAAAFIIPHKERAYVYMRDLAHELMEHEKLMELPMMLGRDASGHSLIYDLAEMQYLLIAGGTGSGKSVCANTIINSILLCRSPEQVKFVLIDHKQVDLQVYKGMPHLLTPPINDPDTTIKVLFNLIGEMENRLERFQAIGVQNIVAYNRSQPNPMPYIVVVIDEYCAELVEIYGSEVEYAVQRMVQHAHDAGIHLIISTQRLNRDVVTGEIRRDKDNSTVSKIVFKMGSDYDYKTVLNETVPSLLWGGDGLFETQGGPAIRFQSAILSEDNAEATIEKLRNYWNRANES